MSNQLSALSLGVGLLAGAASAALSASAMAGGSLAITLYFISPLPIIAAGLGWGTAAAIVAAMVSIAAAGMVSGPFSALVVALTNSVPAVVAAHLAGLARPADEMGGRSDQIVWYPLADILFRLALMIAAAFIILGIAAGYGPHFGAEIAAEMTRALQSADPEFAPGPDFEARLAGFLTRLLPAAQPALSLIVFCGNLYLALGLVRISGRSARPHDDWPAALRMPKLALLVFAVGLIVSFVPGNISHIGTVIAGAMAGGFLLAGLAQFHLRTRGRAWRSVMLWLAYLALGLFAFMVFFFVIAGMFDTSKSAPVSGNPNPPNT